MTADFVQFVKVKEVLLKKRGDNHCRERLINAFKLEYLRRG